MRPQLNKRALHRAIWTAFARLTSVGFGAGAGSLIYKLVGGANLLGWGVAIVMITVSFSLMVFAEYEKELNP